VSARTDDGAPVRVFLSGVASVTHLVYVASYLRHLLAACDTPVIVVNVGLRRFMGRANVGAQDVAALLPDDARLSVVSPEGPDRWHSRPGERRVYVGVGAPGIKPYLRLRASAVGRPLRVVVVDEGIGSYGDWRTRRDSWRREGAGRQWSAVRALAVTGARRLLTDERWALYRRDGDEWLVDDRGAGEFRRRLGKFAPAVTPGGGTAAVFLSQPWVELGVLGEHAYVGHLHEIAAGCQAAGLSFLLRTHPAEDQDRYAGLAVSRQRGPAELDPEVAGAVAVLGTSSTALLNVAALYGTPAVRVAVPGLAHLDDALSAQQRSLLDTFLPAAVGIGELSDRLNGVRPPSPPAR
jgi:hypothetical protein